MTPYRIYDTDREEWLPYSFASFEGAEDYVEQNLESDYIRYEIYEKIS